MLTIYIIEEREGKKNFVQKTSKKKESSWLMMMEKFVHVCACFVWMPVVETTEKR